MSLLDESRNIHALLKDETRRKIIGMLGEHEKVGFKEFKDNLNIGVGTLYYHLDILSDYLTQDKTRKYLLNEKGRLLYRVLIEGTIPAGLKIDSIYQSRGLQWLFLTPVFNKMDSSIKWIILPALILSIGAIGAGLARLEPLLLFYTPTISSFGMIAAIFLLSWIGAFFLIGVLSRLFYQRVGDNIYLLVCMSFAAAPLAVYPYLYMTLYPVVSPTVGTYTLRIVLLVLQVWSLILLTSAFSFGKGLRIEKAAVLSICLIYVNIALLVLSGNLI